MQELLRYGVDPEVLLKRVKHLDMGALVAREWGKFKCRVLEKDEVERRALLCSTIAHFSERLSLTVMDEGVSLDIARVAEVSEHLYSASGYSIWFAPAGFDYGIQLFQRDGERLGNPQQVSITAQSPLLVEGEASVVDVCPCATSGHLVFSLNLPVPLSDIHVYDRATLARIAWFPADAQVPRFLLLLEALEKIQDCNLERVAADLIYHHHPAVRWQAFLALMRCTPEKQDHYCELLESLQDPGLRALLSSYLAGQTS
ncbi:hypothetical protein GPJ81_18150 [Pseudomonas alkylphenolica]|jgi:hypothetical protein|uniref:Uncharacterized protein n=1 Tax=Pseudomonas alkylphenolica TaxID=237609 RepID=A0A6I6GVE6_9PSED|nr:hypothetical protein [Pseudomonas alkylphenolica]QGW78522.1 hypothetical protein GPJ81_18150 [Pseudomonas alkylphenolica]